ncbi:MAG: T9SS type A sorting domain-containing protein [Bacteroidota bacterium]
MLRRRAIPFLLLLTLSILAAVPGAAQHQGTIVPDSLDWRGYYPLDIGNVWERHRYELVAFNEWTREAIVGDTLLGDHRYFIRHQTGRASDTALNDYATWDTTTFIRYDTLNARVVQWQPEGDQPITCRLDTAFGADLDGNCSAFEAHGGYARQESDGLGYVGGILHVDGAPVDYAALKYTGNFFGGTNYFHGIGWLGTIGDGAAGEVVFTYLRIGGREYGVPNRVNTERSSEPERLVHLYPNPAAGWFHLRLPNVQGQPGTVEVFSVLGRRIHKQACTPSPCFVSLAEAAPGVYHVRWQQGGTSGVETVVITR